MRALVFVFRACVEMAHAQPVRIVLPAQPAPPERFAADELVKYLTQMGNPKPQVASAPDQGDIYLGGQPGSGDADSFSIRSEGGKLLLHGNSPRATLYAA